MRYAVPPALALRLVVGLVVGLAPLGAATGAHAQTAEPAQAVCQGPAPVPGQILHGPVLHVPDADRVCVATGAGRDDWVAVPLVHPGAGRRVLMAAAFGRNATCRIEADRRGDCAIDGARLDGLVQREDVLRSAVSWR